jgi:excisionase family DNA binding protein
VSTVDQQRLAYSPDEAAALLGVSRSFFFEHVLPELRVVRVGRRRLVARRELERWLDENGARAIDWTTGRFPRVAMRVGQA